MESTKSFPEQSCLLECMFYDAEPSKRSNPYISIPMRKQFGASDYHPASDYLRAWGFLRTVGRALGGVCMIACPQSIEIMFGLYTFYSKISSQACLGVRKNSLSPESPENSRGLGCTLKLTPKSKSYPFP